MGHSDLQTTMRYTYLVSEDLLALVQEPEEPAKKGLAIA
jgi:integrase